MSGNNQRGLRHQILVRSVNALLEPGETCDNVVVLWNRHRWFYPYCAAAALGLFIVAVASGITEPVNQLLMATCGAAVAALATTNYWILASTSNGFVLCRSSRVRQYAKELVTRYKRTPALEMVGSTVITSDWRVDGTEYTLTKRWESTMRSFES